jgi:hypothetical protein
MWPLFASAACDGFFESMDFLWRERPNRARRQIAQAHWADGSAAQLLHLVADAGKQAADFTVAAFIQHHFKDR